MSYLTDQTLPALPKRLHEALQGNDVYVTRPTHRRAVEVLEEDMRLLAALREHPVARLNRARALITLQNGARIHYIGGKPETVERQLRGIPRDAFVDGYRP